MGTTSSKNQDSTQNSQLFISLKMENFKIKGDLIPHVFGSLPIIRSWDPSIALPMERESASAWELSFVLPSNHETFDFKFLLKPKYGDGLCVVEEGVNRLLTGGILEGDARTVLFRNIGDEEVLEYRFFIRVDPVSPFDLAASWRVYRENLRPSTVRRIPDVSINATPEMGLEQTVSSASLDLDLEHYVVPAPSSSNTGVVYAANFTETPRSLCCTGILSKYDVSSTDLHGLSKAGSVSVDRALTRKDVEIIVPDSSEVFPASGMVESKSVGTFSQLQKQDGKRGLVDRGVGSPMLVKSTSASAFSNYLKLDSEAKKAMPSAAGAVTAAAVADQMHGPKEDQQLAIVLVGLPARGKTFMAAKLTRYLRWLGHETKHFNVGKYRRLKLGANQSADLFRGDNPEGLEARNEVAALAMDDMISWMQEGGQVGIFDATNSTRQRRNMLMKMAEGKCKILFKCTIHVNYFV